MKKSGRPIVKWLRWTLATAVFGIAAPVFSPAADLSGISETGWESARTTRRAAVRTTELTAEPLETRDAIRPVALQQDLWAPEEPAAPLAAPPAGGKFLNPESILPPSSGNAADGASDFPPSPGGFTSTPAPGTPLSTELPVEIPAEPAQPAAEPQNLPSLVPPAAAPQSAPTAVEPVVPLAPSGNVGAQNDQELIPPTLIPGGNQPARQTAKNSKTGTKNANPLAKSESKIDRNGNFGSIGNISGTRTEEGVLLGNPYANGVYEYHPRCFAADPNAQVRLRTAPPVEAYGEDGYGNPALYTCGADSCAAGCVTDDCGYEDCGYGGCAQYGWCGCGLFPSLYAVLQNAEAEAGVFAFKDPLGIGNDNSFGVDIGLNWSMPQRILFGLNAQTGGRFTQTGKEEYFVDGIDDSSRSQFFWTAGLFYRNPADVWQFGAVYDLLRDESCWTYTIGQVRTEISRRCSETTDIGFRGAFAMDDELLNFWADNDHYSGEISVNSYYTGFIRHTFVTGAEGMLYGGATEESEGLIGGHLEVPVTNHSSLRNSFVYVFPNSKENRYLDNSWSVNLTWVVYFGGNSRAGMVNPLRPLFEVADNTSLLQRAKAN